jgi:predicted amidophosphoribosyltransferase
MPIVPVPLYPLRLWWRQFNQSAMLAQAVAYQTGAPADCFALCRVRRRQARWGSRAEKRSRNVAGAFKLEPSHAGLIRGKTIVLVDDVITTGRRLRLPRSGPR